MRDEGWEKRWNGHIINDGMPYIYLFALSTMAKGVVSRNKRLV